jgi:UMF1 family MFS transporter
MYHPPSVATTQVNDRREIFGWAMYDWANSAFSTTVGAVFLGPYLASLVDAAARAEYVARTGVAWSEAAGVPLTASFFGIQVAPESFLPFAISFSVVFQAGFLPILGAIADYSHRRKQMMQLFATLGALATIGLFFVQGDLWWLGGILFMIANLSFGAAVVFYNAYLPDIASPDQRDRVSSFGWALGYLGGGLLLIVNLALFLLHEQIGLTSAEAIRINLASAGLWWLGFAFFTWRTLKPRHSARELPPNQNLLVVAFRQLSETMEAPAGLIAALLLLPLAVFITIPVVLALGLPLEWAFFVLFGPILMLAIFLWRKYRTLPETVKFLVAYLIYNDGIQTVIGVAATFAAAPLERGGLAMPTSRLTLLILMIQFMAFAGALLFGWIAGRVGTKRALIISLFIWAGTVIYAYFGLRGAELVLGIPRAEFEFWLLGACIAVVLGGSQALSRSAFAQMIPKDKEAEFFSIYEISERGTSWMGPFVFAVVNQSLGNLRPAILSVNIFFVVGLAILFFGRLKTATAEG